MSFKLNPFTGNLDWVLCDAQVARIACAKAIEVVQSIVVTDVNALGNKNFFYDATACKWVEAQPQLVVDENGCIVVDTSGIEDC